MIAISCWDQPLVESVRGRTNGLLVEHNCSKVHDVVFSICLRDTPCIEQFKIIQESTAITRVQLVLGARSLRWLVPRRSTLRDFQRLIPAAHGRTLQTSLSRRPAA